MPIAPETNYVRSGDGAHIAYQVVGEGPLDLMLLNGMFMPMESLTDEGPVEWLLHRLTAFSRVILFDRRGIGLSDPISPFSPPTIEQWMRDGLAVLDAVGARRVAVMASGDGVLVASLLAATHPERTTALVLIHGTARLAWAQDTPWGRQEEVQVGYETRVERDTGRALPLPLIAPSVAEDPAFVEWFARTLRHGASPSVARVLSRVIYDSDIRDILPNVAAPTLVLHRSGNKYHDVGHSRYLADHIPDARFVEIPGEDHLPFLGDADAMVDEIEEFLTGVRPPPEADRLLATVMFTDIVESTQRVATMGDRRWREMLDRHDALVGRQLSRFHGHMVNPTGDGLLATFDGPARAIRCALAIRDGAQQLGLQVRAGLHTGEVELRGPDVGGIAVHIGARVASLAAPSEILVSRTVVDLVAGSGITFDDRGTHELKGLPDTWRLFAVAHA